MRWRGAGITSAGSVPAPPGVLRGGVDQVRERARRGGPAAPATPRGVFSGAASLRSAVVFSRHLVRGMLAGLLLAPLWLYRRFVSPALPPACRYYPSCSLYAEQALLLHGPFRGLWLSARRLLRCHPFCEGGLDPVPPRQPARTASPRSA